MPVFTPGMKMMARFFLVSLTFSLLACTSGPPESPEPGMEVIDRGRHREFQAALGVDWASYTRINLERATVEFRKNWVRDQKQRNENIIRESDQERIKSDLSDLLDEVLARELTDSGDFTMTAESGLGVMRFTPRVVDLDVIAPDIVRNYIGHTLTDSQGRMTLELDIHDAASGKLLATSRQFQDDPEKGYLERTSSVTNRTAFRLMLLRWSEWLIEQLDEVRAEPAG